MLRHFLSNARSFFSRNNKYTVTPSVNALRNNENGNIFFMLFGAVAVVGTLGAVTVSTMRGPLSTMVEVQARTKAESEMAIASRLAMLEATELANSGDCDGDGFVEPLEYRTGGGPTGGGLLPSSISSSRIDPWGTEYGYCVWDGGTTINDTINCDNNGTAGLQILDGDGSAGESYTIIAIISAGEDQVFQTTCTEGPPSLNKGGDDIVSEFTYAAAAVATDGLWNLKSGDPDTAQIAKNLEIDGSASFSGGIDLRSSTSALTLGAASMLFPTDTTPGMGNGDCNAANHGLLRVNTATDPDTLEICDSSTGWSNVGSGGSVWSQNTGNEIFFDSVGTTEVGIGTNAPTRTLDIVGTLGVSGSVFLGNDLDVSGTSTFDDVEVTTLNASDAVDFDTTLNVDGTSTLADVNANATTVTTLGASGAVNLDDELNVDGETTLTGTLNAQASIFNGTGNVNIADDLDVRGNYTSNTGNITLTDGTVEADNYTWNGNDFTPSTCASGNFNRWDGNSWVCENDTAGGGGGGAIQENLSDDDGDTLIQLEETVDDDTIRFDTAGSQRVTIGPTGDVDMRGDGTSLNIDLNNSSGYPTLTSTATHIRLVENIVVDQRTFQITDSGNDRRTTMSHLNNTDFRMTTSQGSIFLQPAENVGIGDFTSDTIDSTLHIQTGDIRLDGGADNQAGCIRFVEGTGLQFSDDCSTFTAFRDVTGTPGGSSTQIQYNDGGSFAGDSGLTYDDINNTLTVDGAVVINGQTGDAPAFANIEDLDNVSISSIADDQCLKYNNATSNWENEACAAGSSLWTDNTTHISRGSVHFLNAGETMTSSGLTPTLGMLWYEDKQAFRVGNVSQWTADSHIGQGSVMMGGAGSAFGNYAMSLGWHNMAYGASSLAAGSETRTDGIGAIALGRRAQANANYSMAFGLGSPAGTTPMVSSVSSLGIFMGDQSGYDLSTSNRMALVGGDFLIDDDGTAGSQGCIRYVEGTGLQFSHDCSTYTNMGAASLSWPLTAPDGTEAAPSYAFANSTGSGLYYDGTNMHMTTTEGSIYFDVDTDNNNGTDRWIWRTPNHTYVNKMTLSGTTLNIGADQDGDINGLDINGWSGDQGIIITNDFSGDGDAIIKMELTEDTPLITMGLDDSDADRFKISGGVLDTNDRITIETTGEIGLGDFTGDTIDSALHVLTGDIRLDGGAANEAGCIRYNDTADQLQFSHDCSTFTTMGGVASGSIAINDLSDAYTDYTTDFNFYLGNGAGVTSSPGQYNLALGQNALTSLDGTCSSSWECNSNIAIGYDALTANTTGSSNIAVGYNTLATVTTNSNNIAIGTNALNVNTASDLVAIGSNAMAANTTGSGNLAIGYNSLSSNVSGGQIIAIGRDAAGSATTNNWMVAIGNGALSQGAEDSTAVGHGALEDASGSFNTALGRNAMLETTTGYSNTAVGFEALDANLDGANNTAIGVAALGANTSGGANTALGAGAGANITTGSSNIIIGRNINAPSATASNQLNIGNLIYGDLANEDFIVGSYQLDDTTAGTEDSRLFFDKSKAAFRAGGVAGTEWDDANVGNASTAFGTATTASGAGSFASGNGATASGQTSTSLGSSTTASGDWSLATNASTTASGDHSIAMGKEVKATGTQYTMAIGLSDQTNTDADRPQVSGEGSIGIFMDQTDSYNLSATDTLALIGGQIMIDDDGAAGSQGCIRFVEGTGLQFSHDCSTFTTIGASTSPFRVNGAAGSEVVNNNTTAPAVTADFVFGSYQLDSTGNIAENARFFFDKSKAAFRAGSVSSTQWDSANVGDGSFAAGSQVTASGEISAALGASTASAYAAFATGDSTASSDYAIAMGESSTSSGYASLAVGETATASGDSSAAFGSNTTASGTYSFTAGEGNTASGNNSVALGSNSTASAFYSFAGGVNAVAAGGASLALGNDVTANGEASIALGNDVTAGNGGGVGDHSLAIGLGIATGARPSVTGDSSVGIFMGDQSGTTVSDANTFSIMGASGGVGVGTTSPASDLHVYANSANGNYALTIENNGDDGELIKAVNDAGTDIMLLEQNAAGNPALILQTHTLGGSNAYLEIRTQSGARYSQLSGGALNFAPGDFGAYDTNLFRNGDDILRTNDSFIVDGSLGVGTTSPNADLEVFSANNSTDTVLRVTSGLDNSNTARSEIQLREGNSGGYDRGINMYYDGAAGDHFGLEVINSGGTTEALRIERATGFMGILNNAPSVALDVTGDIEYTGTITDVSDIRLKDNIKPLNKTGKLLERINQIETYSFTMKGDETSRIEYGVMAQELEDVFPTLVHTADDEMGTKSVNYVGLVAPMIEATKELKAENDSLKSQMNDLSQQVALLNKMAGNNVGKASMRDFILLLFGLFCGMALMVGLQRRNNG